MRFWSWLKSAASTPQGSEISLGADDGSLSAVAVVMAPTAVGEQASAVTEVAQLIVLAGGTSEASDSFTQTASFSEGSQNESALDSVTANLAVAEGAENQGVTEIGQLMVSAGGTAEHGMDLSTTTATASSQESLGSDNSSMAVADTGSQDNAEGTENASMAATTQTTVEVAGNYSWVAPFTGTLTVECIGGGGGGGGGSTTYGGGGGGGGGYALADVSVIEGTTYYFEVGSGGSPGTGGSSGGTSGNASWFNTSNSLTGALCGAGAGGGGAQALNTPAGGAGGGTFAGTVVFTGGAGGSGGATTGGGAGGGAAGATGNGGAGGNGAAGAPGGTGNPPGGNGAGTNSTASAGQTGKTPGGGGSGGWFALTSPYNGAPGAPGMVRLSWGGIS